MNSSFEALGAYHSMLWLGTPDVFTHRAGRTVTRLTHRTARRV
jgi:hypothetical protein